MPTLMRLLAPAQAWAQDLDGAQRSDFGAADAEWIVLATVLHRLSGVRAKDRDALRQQLAPALPSIRNAESADDIATYAMERAASMEEVGAFRLAYATLTSLHVALPTLSDAVRGLIIAQQGRVARQFGDVSLAREHYEEALRVGTRIRSAEVSLRALLGFGVLANMRGNYPEARQLFQAALQQADTPALAPHAAAAHHGLMLGSLAASDLSAALLHGWAAFERVGADPDRRADRLVNLGEICLRMGEYRAALHCYRLALRRTSLARLRLAALGGAVLAAASARHNAELARLAHMAEEEIARAQQPFESAQTLIELAEAFEIAGATDRAATYRDRAAETAERGGFYEVIHRADSVAARLAARTDSSRRSLDDASARIVRAIEALPLDEPASLGAS